MPTETQASMPEKAPERLLRCYRCDESFRTETTRHTVACPHCGARVTCYRAKIHWAAGDQMVRALAEGPKPLDALPNETVQEGYRDLVHKIKPPATSTASSTRTWGGTTVYYLVGDERRAMTRFIAENEDFVARQLSADTPHCLLQQTFDEHFWQLLLEQWYWFHDADTDREAIDAAD